MQFRSFFKPAGTNPEIKGPFYELSCYVRIVGHSNFESLTLGFNKGSFSKELVFRPIDPAKPIVLAVEEVSNNGFVYIDHHLKEGAEAGMHNYSAYKTDDFLIDCQLRDVVGGGHDYWSVTSEGMTFVFGEELFPDTWHLSDCDPLCAFVAGELTANQIRSHAYFSNREAAKEERREAHIELLNGEVKHLKQEIEGLKHELVEAHDFGTQHILGYARLHVDLMSKMIENKFPLINKRKILQVLKDSSV